MTDVHQCRKVDSLFFLFLCFQNHVFLALHFIQFPRWHVFELFPFFVNCSSRIQNSHRLWRRNKLVHQIVVTQRIVSFACDVAFTVHAYFVFQLDSVIPLAAVSCSSLKRFFVFFFCRASPLPFELPIFSCSLDGFCVLSIFRIDEAIPVSFRAWSSYVFFHSPIFLSSWRLTFLTKVQATNNQVWISLAVLLVSHRTTYISREVFLSKKKVNFVNLCQESDKLRFTSTFQ